MAGVTFGRAPPAVPSGGLYAGPDVSKTSTDRAPQPGGVTTISKTPTSNGFLTADYWSGSPQTSLQAYLDQAAQGYNQTHMTPTPVATTQEGPRNFLLAQQPVPQVMKPPAVIAPVPARRTLNPNMMLNNISRAGGNLGGSSSTSWGGYGANNPSGMYAGQSLSPSMGTLAINRGGSWSNNTGMSGGGGGGGGGKYLCTVYRGLGWLPEDIWRADMKAAASYSPAIRVGYRFWGEPLAGFLRKKGPASLIARHLLWPLVRAWAFEMARKTGVHPHGSVFGLFLEKVCIWPTWGLGKVIRAARRTRFVNV